MARRACFIAVLVTALVGFASLPVAAQSGRTFYIDYANGSNSSNGMEATPWKTHPYMQTGAACTETGSAPAYSHQAGDHFIFKGGVTWPGACFEMAIQSGGTSSARDYYGVDQSWYSGSSWTRPRFDLNYVVPAGQHVIWAANGNSGYMTFDNFEIAHQKVTLGTYGADDAYNFSYGDAGTIIANNFIHDWVTDTNISGGLLINYSTGAVFDNSNGVILDHTEISDAGGYAYYNGVKTPLSFGGACHNCKEVRFSKIHHTMAGCFTVTSCHDNEFYKIIQSAPLTTAGVHTQVIEDDQPCGGAAMDSSIVYNNVIHDNSAGVNIFVKYNSYIYNNVMLNNTNNYQIRLCTSSSDSTSKVGYIRNNTIQCLGGCVGASGSGTFLGTLHMENNHWIADGTVVCLNTNGCFSVGSIVQSNNVTMSTATAAAQGYTSLNEFAPTSTKGGTVAAAANFSSGCSGGQASLCADRLQVARPSSGAWDAGAYESSGQASKPNAPTALSAVVLQ